jgi:hypothetical protein
VFSDPSQTSWVVRLCTGDDWVSGVRMVRRCRFRIASLVGRVNGACLRQLRNRGWQGTAGVRPESLLTTSAGPLFQRI